MAVSFLETGILYCEDNLLQLAQFPDECVDLIYLDPPFFSNRKYEVIWGDEAEVRSFEDRWKGGIEVYIDWMHNRVAQMRRVLKSTGSLYLHCDPHASHYLKVMLDQIFDVSNFRNELIWKRTTAHSDNKQGRHQYGAVHDVLFLYTKTDQWQWNSLYTAYDDSYVAAKYPYEEEGTGRRYGLWDMTGPGGAAKGNPQYEVMGIRRYWRYSQTEMAFLIEQGRVVQPRPGAVPRYKRYLDEGLGVPLQDVWTDICPVNSQAAERLGYPTQKPEALLERIVAVSSNAGDIVLDPFCGCGTTVAVAERMDRRWIGIDISPTAVNLTRRRLERFSDCCCTPKVVGLPVTAEELRQLKSSSFKIGLFKSSEAHILHASPAIWE